MPRAVLLMGPTAGGKSRVAMEAARRLGAEIVSVDSAQVYAGMDVGTAKASPAERAEIPHHLLDILPPTASYSAARFREDALRITGEISSRGRIALLVGGTMLYYRALTAGLSSLPPADPGVRADIDREAAEVGWPAMHARLAAVDPESAERLRPRDSQRIQRALEVFRLTGGPMSRLLGSPVQAGPSPFQSIALVPADRQLLHRKIEARFDQMLADGLVDELAALRRRYALSPGLPSMRAVGYRQAWEHLEGRLGRDELRNRGIYATRQLAKRQLTWLRSWRTDAAFDCFEPALADRVCEAIRRAAEA